MRSTHRSGSALEACALALIALAPLGCDVLTGGCGDDLDDEPAALYTEGTTDDGSYISSAWDAQQMLDFPPGLAIQLVHGLGTVPTSWGAYIATERKGDGAAIVLSTGEVELIQIDEQTITVRNSTCADLFLLVTAEGR
jgi:hypothetical protein